jgi:hypothetical protein
VMEGIRYVASRFAKPERPIHIVFLKASLRTKLVACDP